jgi:ABC-type transporter Mla MlaB component
VFTTTNTMGSTSKTPKKLPGTPTKKDVEKPQSSGELERKLAEELTKTDGWLTRNEASDVLRCSLQTLKNYESRGLLHPRHGIRKDRSGGERVMLVYNPKELAELPTRNGVGQPRIAIHEPGEQAARAFELLREGRPLDEIVVELRETPDRIDYLHERWLEHTQARYVISIEAKKALEQLVGAFTDVADLIELVKKKSTAS